MGVRQTDTESGTITFVIINDIVVNAPRQAACAAQLVTIHPETSPGHAEADVCAEGAGQEAVGASEQHPVERYPLPLVFYLLRREKSGGLVDSICNHIAYFPISYIVNDIRRHWETNRRGSSPIRRERWQGKKTVSGTSPCTSQSQRTGAHQKKNEPAAEGGLHSYGDSLSVV